jgi:hypothetical protein
MTAKAHALALPKPGHFLALWALLASFLLLAGCGGIYLDPGPQAATLKVPVQGQVTPAMRAQAALPFGGLEWADFPPRFHTFSEPLWDVQAFILAPDGGLHQLPPTPATAMQEKEGYAVDSTVEFLAPPGTHRMRVLFTCSVRHEYWDDFGKHRDYLYLMAADRLLDLTLTPGGTATIEGFTGRVPRLP